MITKNKSVSRSAFLKVHILIGLSVILAGIFAAVLGVSAFSNAAAEGKASSKVLAQKDVGFKYGSTRDALSKS